VKEICVHGHFYQPTRVNPWTDTLEPQPSAAPFRDWNERIAFECYAPNMAARLLDGEGELRGTRNNYAGMTFDIGPTLLNWIASERPVILDGLRMADRRSQRRFGKGSAIAQPYHHPILPLCDDQDRTTEVQWGLAIFRRVFGRSAEGIWLSETAVNEATLETVAEAGISFVILAPHQIGELQDSSGAWVSADEEMCANRAFRISLPSGRSVSALVYDGAASRAVAFEGLLDDGGAFADRMISAAEKTGLAVIATDGESYGHHHTFGEMALAYALDTIEGRDDVRLTNAASWLDRNPPKTEARILDPSSWSCAHGVGRWFEDCGCRMDAAKGWHQRWRGPLRGAFEQLRDEARKAIEPLGYKLFADPVAARDAYGQIIGRPELFSVWYHEHSGATKEEGLALRWLEVHRHLLAMFTSCAWFFDEVTGIEPLQNIRHAACAVGQLRELVGVDLAPALTKSLETVPGNIGNELLIATAKSNFAPPQGNQDSGAFYLPERRAGVLMPVSSLGGEGPIGDLDGARDFIDWLADSGMSVWQVLPLVPTDDHGSPYSSWSTLSGNPDLVGLAGCVNAGLLDGEAMPSTYNSVDYQAAREEKRPWVLKAAERLLDDKDHQWSQELRLFVDRNPWATEAALFHAIKVEQGGAPWWTWPEPVRRYEVDAVGELKSKLHREIDIWRAALFIFEHQWGAVRRYAMARGIRLVGDMPIYVGWDSVDVWANQSLFELDTNGIPRRVAGVPPDAYSETGQLWGNPLFDWDAMEADGYKWWVQRVRRTLEHCDVLRIDHFIGFARYWAINSGSVDASSGSWIKGPGRRVFDAIEAALGCLPLIAEDLGLVDDTTIELRDGLGLPGMKVIQFGLDGDPNNPHHIDRHNALSVVYTGTHDSSTARGWWEAQDTGTRDRLDLGNDGAEAAQSMVMMALESESFWAIIPLQDLLGLGDEARINRPGTVDNNWVWRAPEGGLPQDVSRTIRQAVERSGRHLTHSS